MERLLRLLPLSRLGLGLDYGWYGNKHHNNWNKYGHKNWDNDWHNGKGNYKGQAYKNGNWNKYH